MAIQPPIDYASRLVSPTQVMDSYLDRKVQREKQDQANLVNQQNIAASRASQLRTEGLTEQESLATENAKVEKGIMDGLSAASAVVNAKDFASQNATLEVLKRDLDPNTKEGSLLLNKITELQGLDFEATREQANQIAQGLYQEGVTRGFIEPPKVAKVDTSVQTIMQAGRPVKALIDNQTGSIVRVIGEAQAKGGPSTVVNVGPDASEFDKKMAGLSVDTIKENNKIVNMKTEYSSKLGAALSIAKGLKKEGTSFSGKVDNLLNPIKSVINDLGIDVDSINDIETLDGILTEIAIKARVPGSGPDTDADFRNRVNALGSLENDEDALIAKLELQKAASDYEQKYLKQKSKLIRKYKNFGDEAEVELEQWKEDNPFSLPKLSDELLGRLPSEDADVMSWEDL